MGFVEVNNVKIGEGKPKVIIPIVGKNKEEVLKAVEEAKEYQSDLIEWRIDYYQKVFEEGEVTRLAKEIKKKTDQPFLITFRSHLEGGEREISNEKYFKLYFEILKNNVVDMIDIELNMPSNKVREIIKSAQKNDIKVILSNHDFEKTPQKNEIIERLFKMSELGADICKIAVTPNDLEDVFTLLSATYETHKKLKKPLITMSMGELGKISRVCGELIGSSATFGTVQESSAPGQIPIDQLKISLKALSFS